MFREIQAETLAWGWWGLISMFANVGCVLGNWSASAGHRRTLLEPQGRDPQVEAPLSPFGPLAPPVTGRTAPWLSTCAFVGLIVFILTAGSGSPGAGDGVDPTDGPGSTSSSGGAGTCLTGSGYVVDCGSSEARYQIVSEVPDPQACPAFYTVFTSSSGNVFCARSM
jgi:hypothetical protein